MLRHSAIGLCLVVLTLSIACRQSRTASKSTSTIPLDPVLKPLPPNAPPELKLFIDGAIQQVGVTTGYDPSYVKIAYPGGDVPIETGVCSDVIVRAFRKAGLDLQQKVHEDMKAAWSEYPTRWNLNRPDPNIDHRRVLNLMKYLERKGKSLPTSNKRDDYLPGDIVTWDLGNGVDHIGVVSNVWSEKEKRCLIVHNIGAGARLEDVLFSWTVTGHYRYF